METTVKHTHSHPALVEVAVLILFFNRPEPLKAVFEQVRKARPSKLFLYQDGPRGEKDLPGIQACRKVVDEIDWECEVHQWYQEQNFGCDPSEYLSQKWAFSHVDKCIVLEDDDIPSVSFFRFCKELLDKYENDTRICMISGINYDEVTKDIPYDYFSVRPSPSGDGLAGAASSTSGTNTTVSWTMHSIYGSWKNISRNENTKKNSLNSAGITEKAERPITRVSSMPPCSSTPA